MQDSGITFKVYVQPRSSKNQIVGRHGDALKLKLTAPPVDNAANRMCIRFMAESLGLPPSCVTIKSGHSARVKQLCARPKAGSDLEKEGRRVKALLKSWLE